MGLIILNDYITKNRKIVIEPITTDKNLIRAHETWGPTRMSSIFDGSYLWANILYIEIILESNFLDGPYCESHIKRENKDLK